MSGNEPAFPASTAQHIHANGLTKRELFAAMAMQGILSNHALTSFVAQEQPNQMPESFAEMAKENADALLAELGKEGRE